MDNRPAGISILAFIYILVGMLGMMLNPTPIMQGWATYLTYAILIVSAAALYLRHRWAWWVLGTLTAFSIMLNCINLFAALSHLDSLPNASKYYLKFGGKLLLQSLILIYLFSQPVINFFAFKSDNKTQKLFMLFGAAGIIYLILVLV